MGSAIYSPADPLPKQKEKAVFITQFPFEELTGGIILMRAALNEYEDSLNFILDTGSGAISLDSLTAAQLGINTSSAGIRIKGIGGEREAYITQDNTLHFPELEVSKLDFYINNYSLLSSVYGVRIDGIIGYTFLSRYIVAVDFDQHLIQIYSKGAFQYSKNSFLLKPIIARIPYHDFSIRDNRSITSRFFIDIGAGLCFLISKKFEEDSSFLKKKRKPVEISVQGSGGKQSLHLTVMKRLDIGPFRFRKVPVNIFDDANNLLAYPMSGGLIGNDILRRFNIVIDYGNNTIALKRNSHFRDKFDYSYTGMNIYLEMDESIVIDDIVPHSPAEKAGLKNGDVIIAVDRDFSGNISAYRHLLKEAGKRVELVLRRDGEIVIKKIRIGRIK